MGDRLVEQVHMLEAARHRYLKQPNDELMQRALLTTLATFYIGDVSTDQPAIVRGLAAQCQTYADLLTDDLKRGTVSPTLVPRLCKTLADLREAVDGT